DSVNKTVSATPIGPRSYTNSAYFLYGSLRAQILRTDEKDDAGHKSEGVPEHELFHFPVVDAAPVGSGYECPTDFDLAFFLVVSVGSRRHDGLAILCTCGDQRSSVLQSLAGKYLKFF